MIYRDLSCAVMVPFFLFLTHFVAFVCLFLYFVRCHVVLSILCSLSLPWFSSPCSFESFISVVIADPNSVCENCDTKTRLWGFASCIASMCLFCSLSSPLPQYDSRWWLSSLPSPMMPQWCPSLLHLLVPPYSHCATLLLLLLLAFLSSSSHPCGLVFHLHCLDIRSVCV